MHNFLERNSANEVTFVLSMLLEHVIKTFGQHRHISLEQMFIKNYNTYCHQYRQNFYYSCRKPIRQKISFYFVLISIHELVLTVFRLMSLITWQYLQ